LKPTILAEVKAKVVGVTAIGAQGGRFPNAWNICGGLRRGKRNTKTNGLKSGLL